jgi:hypothetical protein
MATGCNNSCNIKKFYILPTLYLCVLYLYYNKQRLLPYIAYIDLFYNRDEKCLLRGTSWVFKLNSLRFVFKGLKSNFHTNVGAVVPPLSCTI